jgi:hypothetical protein
MHSNPRYFTFYFSFYILYISFYIFYISFYISFYILTHTLHFLLHILHIQVVMRNSGSQAVRVEEIVQVMVHE